MQLLKKWVNTIIISSKTNSTMTLEMASYIYKRVSLWKTTTEETTEASYLLPAEQQQWRKQHIIFVVSHFAEL